MWLHQESGIARLLACALFVLVVAGATRPAVAAKVYRCGNVFQDQPCTADKEAEARAATKPAIAREAPIQTAPTRPAPSTASTREPERLVLDTPRSITIEARR